MKSPEEGVNTAMASKPKEARRLHIIEIGQEGDPDHRIVKIKGYSADQATGYLVHSGEIADRLTHLSSETLPDSEKPSEKDRSNPPDPILGNTQIKVCPTCKSTQEPFVSNCQECGSRLDFPSKRILRIPAA